MPVENGRYIDPIRDQAGAQFSPFPPPPVPEFELTVDKALAEVKAMLIAKNQAYGNSALDPVRVFSNADAAEQLRVRIDDKLSRLMRGMNNGVTEDTVLDLLGYLVLLRIAERTAA